MRLALCALLATAVLPLAAQPCSVTSFETAPWIRTEGGAAGAVPYPFPHVSASVAGDFDGDGHADVVVANGGEGYVDQTPGLVLYRGDGAGRLYATPRFAADVYGEYLIAADFDRDRLPDIAVATTGTDEVLLFRNSGGTFVRTGRYKLVGDSAPMAAGDFDGDGDVDIAVPAGELLILEGRGDGTFGQRRVVGDYQVMDAVAADVDRDGRDDLLTVMRSVPDARIRYGTATGLLGDPVSVPLPFNARQIIVADFDGSGRPDVLARELEAGRRSALFRDPARAFGTPVLQNALPFYPAAVADFSGDGRPDLLTQTAGEITVSVAAADGTFTSDPRRHYGDPWSFNEPVVADFDGNGAPDAATIDSRFVTVLLNTGGGRFAAPAYLPVTDIRAVLDLDGDGRNDLIANDATLVWLANPDGTFRPGAARRPSNTGTNLMDVADVDRDGNLDVVLLVPSPSVAGRLWILRGDGRGTFAGPPPVDFAYRPVQLRVIDLDGDGHLDIVAGNELPPPGSLNTSPVTIAFGRGDGTFEAAVTQGRGRGSVLNIADINGDGRLDFITGDHLVHEISLATGPRTWAGNVVIERMEPFTIVTDMNGDGLADWVEASSTGEFVEHLAEVRVRLSRGDGTFGMPLRTVIPRMAHVSAMKIGDVHGDRRPDVILLDFGVTDSHFTAVVLQGKGDGTLASATYYPAAGLLQLLDFNRDGLLDLVHGKGVRLNTCAQAVPRPRAIRRR